MRAWPQSLDQKGEKLRLLLQRTHDMLGVSALVCIFFSGCCDTHWHLLQNKEVACIRGWSHGRACNPPDRVHAPPAFLCQSHFHAFIHDSCVCTICRAACLFLNLQ